MTTKGANITLSTSIILVALAVVWLLELSTVISEPPGRGPWYSYPASIVPLIFLPTVPWFAARRWYWPPLFFGFGVFSMFPTVFFIFGPEVSRGHLVYDPPHPLLTIGGLCCAAGIATVFIGSLSSRASLRNTRNA